MLLRDDAEDVSVRTVDGACEITQTPTASLSSVYMWLGSTSDFDAGLIREGDAVRIEVEGDGFVGEGRLEPGPPLRLSWTVRAP